MCLFCWFQPEKLSSESVLFIGAGSKIIWADGGYSGKLQEEIGGIDRHRKVKLEIVKRSDDVKGFEVLPK